MNNGRTVFGRLVKNYRDRNELTLAQLAARMGVSTSFIGDLEFGNVRVPDRMLAQFHEALPGSDIRLLTIAAWASNGTIPLRGIDEGTRIDIATRVYLARGKAAYAAKTKEETM